MNARLAALLAELEEFGRANDASTRERSRRMLNITRDTGAFLSFLVRACGARRILEAGTSNGYSTLWLAEAAEAVDGRVVTVEASAAKVALARRTFERSGLAHRIELVHSDAGRFLGAAADGAFDLVFLDSERSEYVRWWPDVERVLRRGGVLVVDNATSHAEELAEFVRLVSSGPEFVSVVVPVGKGELVATHTDAALARRPRRGP